MRVKNLFWIVTILVFILTVFPAITKAVQASVSVSPTTSIYDPTETFDIAIDVSDVTDLAQWETKLSFDNVVLDLVDVVEGPFLQAVGTTEFGYIIGASLDYIVVYSALWAAGGASGSGTLATVTFQVADTGSCALDLYETKLYDSAMQEITEKTVSDGDFHTTYYRPVAIFDYSSSYYYPKVDVHKPVTFDASDSYDEDGTIVGYSWNFGDGNETTTSNPIIVHTYTDVKTFIVTLTVTDDDGRSDTPGSDSPGSVIVVLPGDINGDGKVDWQDLFVFARAYGSLMGQPAYVAEADFNSDGKIDWQDLFIFARNYGRTV